MPYRYLEDVTIADVAFEAWGSDLPELFRSAADATMNVMIECLETIGKRESLEFVVQNSDLDMLLFNFLQELIFYKDAKKLLLRVFAVAITENSSGFILHASAFGERLDPGKHHPLVDVKAVTLYRLSLRKYVEGWTAAVVLDV